MRLRDRKTKMECSCASKRMKMNPRATSWVTHGDEIYFSDNTTLEPIMRVAVAKLWILFLRAIVLLCFSKIQCSSPLMQSSSSKFSVSLILEGSSIVNTITHHQHTHAHQHSPHLRTHPGKGCVNHKATLFILWIVAVFVDWQRNLR